jgi:inositol-hexakisphosphate/diphosphoinositol-pentakisphosphate 1-kinase
MRRVYNSLIFSKELDRERACGCERETLICMYKRWMKLDKDFLNKSSRKYDISKIPDVYDSIKYDEVHNSILSNPERKELMRKIAIMNSFVTPMEYGIVTKQKLKIGMSVWVFFNII